MQRGVKSQSTEREKNFANYISDKADWNGKSWKHPKFYFILVGSIAELPL